MPAWESFPDIAKPQSSKSTNLRPEGQVLASMSNLTIKTEEERRMNREKGNEYSKDEDPPIEKRREYVSHASRLTGDVSSVSMKNLTRSDGFLIDKQKWQFFLSPANRREPFPSLTQPPKPEPTLTTIMFRIAQNRPTTGLRPAKTAVTPDRSRKRPVGSRKLKVNSIRHSAYAARSEKKMQMKRAKTAKEASLSGRSLRALHQITHVEAIAASELEKRRNEWLEDEERRKTKERMKLQRKVNHFIAKVEEDKVKLRKLQDKTLGTLVNVEVRGMNKYCKAEEDAARK